jgi:CRP-like cAMP-binding protein
VLGFWGINDLLGQPLSRIEFYQIESLTPLEMRAISPVHMYSEVTNLIAHGQQIEELFWIQRHRTLETRLRCFLRWLDLKFGREIDIGRLIDLPLSHQQIAETIGSTRVTITRLIRRLVQQDILQQHYRRLIILDRERI